MDIRSIEIGSVIKKIYGNGAQLEKTGDHAYDWKVRVNGSQQNLDMKRVVTEIHGNNFQPVLTGAGIYDWCAIDFASGRHEVLPVLIASSDMFYSTTSVRSAVDDYIDNIRLAQDWYSRVMGKTYTVIGKALVIESAYDGNQWDQWAAQTDLPDITPHPTVPNREVLLRKQQGTLKSAFGRDFDLAGTIVCVGVYTGKGTTVSGAGAITNYAGGHFVTQPPLFSEYRASALPDTDQLHINAIYSLAHELGHAFGLIHPDQRPPPLDPNAHNSIMSNPTNHFSKATLLAADRLDLDKSPFIR